MNWSGKCEGLGGGINGVHYTPGFTLVESYPTISRAQFFFLFEVFFVIVDYHFVAMNPFLHRIFI